MRLGSLHSTWSDNCTNISSTGRPTRGPRSRPAPRTSSWTRPASSSSPRSRGSWPPGPWQTMRTTQQWTVGGGGGEGGAGGGAGARGLQLVAAEMSGRKTKSYIEPSSCLIFVSGLHFSRQAVVYLWEISILIVAWQGDSDLEKLRIKC